MHQAYKVQLKKYGEEIKKNISLDLLGMEIEEISKGLYSGIDVSRYIDKGYNRFQMREIRIGLEERLAVNYYEKALFTWKQMREIRLALMNEIKDGSKEGDYGLNIQR